MRARLLFAWVTVVVAGCPAPAASPDGPVHDADRADAAPDDADVDGPEDALGRCTRTGLVPAPFDVDTRSSVGARVTLVNDDDPTPHDAPEVSPGVFRVAPTTYRFQVQIDCEWHEAPQDPSYVSSGSYRYQLTGDDPLTFSPCPASLAAMQQDRLRGPLPVCDVDLAWNEPEGVDRPHATWRLDAEYDAVELSVTQIEDNSPDADGAKIGRASCRERV